MPISKTPGTFGDLLVKFEIALPKGPGFKLFQILKSLKHKTLTRKRTTTKLSCQFPRQKLIPL